MIVVTSLLRELSRQCWLLKATLLLMVFDLLLSELHLYSKSTHLRHMCMYAYARINETHLVAGGKHYSESCAECLRLRTVI